MAITPNARSNDRALRGSRKHRGHLGAGSIVVTCSALLAVSGLHLDSALAESTPCDLGKSSLPAGIIEQVTALDATIESLQKLLSDAQAAQAQINRAISEGSKGGDEEIILSEQEHVMQVRERELARQLAELKALKQRFCAAASVLKK